MADALRAFLIRHPEAALIRVVAAKGSTPRDAGAWMLSADGETLGTVGGGRLEHDALAAARRLSAGDGRCVEMDVVLGPETGQCCGGRVSVEITRLNAAGRRRLKDEARASRSSDPCVVVFGAGHVGRALARQLHWLPFRVLVVDSRPQELKALDDGIEGRCLAVPETAVRDAPPGAAYVILTHDHGLDFLIAAEALKRADAPYVGLIGSASKRALLARRLGAAAAERLICPIGGGVIGGGVKDKRPGVIALRTAAELMDVFHRSSSPEPWHRLDGGSKNDYPDKAREARFRRGGGSQGR